MDGKLACSDCGGVIGVWEPILLDGDPCAEPTTLLQVWDKGIEPGALWHAECAREQRSA